MRVWAADYRNCEQAAHQVSRKLWLRPTGCCVRNFQGQLMLRCARQSGLVQTWENKLAKFGLSHVQLRREYQTVTGPEETLAFQAHAHDKELKIGSASC